MRILCLAVASALAFAPPIAAVAAEASSTLSLTGTGVVRSTPDTVVVRVGVETVKDEAAAALSENSARVRAILATLRDAGVPDEAIQTTALSVQPLYSGSKQRSFESAERIDGYRVTNTVRVQMDDAKALGVVLDRVVEAGANRIYGISFALKDNDDALAEARRRAVADAMAKAELYTKAAGLALGPIRSFVEQGPGSPRAEVTVARSASAVPVQPGQVRTAVQVHIVWDIAPLR